MDLCPELAELAGNLLGAAVVDARPVPGGYIPALRRRLELADGRSAFLKAALDPEMAIRLRREAVVYSRLVDSFMPRMLGWNDDAPCSSSKICRSALGCRRGPMRWLTRSCGLYVGWRATRPLPAWRSSAIHSLGVVGPRVQRDPLPFLSVGLCSASWLRRALPALVAVSLPEYTYGDALLHLDVRSDNLCFRNGQAVIFDWDLTTIGNPELDVAFWLPSLEAEGGPNPSAVADCRPEIVAIVAGFFAARAGLPVIPRRCPQVC